MENAYLAADRTREWVTRRAVFRKLFLFFAADLPARTAYYQEIHVNQDGSAKGIKAWARVALPRGPIKEVTVFNFTGSDAVEIRFGEDDQRALPGSARGIPVAANASKTWPIASPYLFARVTSLTSGANLLVETLLY